MIKFNLMALFRDLRTFGVMGTILILVMVNFTITASSIDNNYNNNIHLTDENKLSDNYECEIIHEKIELEFDYVIEEVRILGENWDLLRFEDCIYSSVPGQPKMPFKVIELVTPSEIASLAVDYRGSSVIYPLKLAPAPTIQILTDTPENTLELPQCDIDYDYYSRNEFLPSQEYNLNFIGKKHENSAEYHIYSLELYPFKYNPAGLNGVFYNNIEVEYKYELPLAVETLYDSRSTRDASNTVKYLIITTTDFVDELQPLVAWKTRKGLPAQIRTVSEIYADPLFDGDDDAEEIRNCIQWSHNELGVEYVLLAGDYNYVPTRHTYDAQAIYTGDNGIIPADTYYACIDEGTTWNPDGDGDFGELGELDDTIPDVIVGRIAISSKSGMANWVVENLEYERNPPAGDWFEELTLVADYGHAVGDCAYQNQFLYDNYLQNCYDSNSKLTDDSSGTDYITGPKIQEKINNGTALLVYTDHGSYTAWGMTITFTNSEVSSLTNGGAKPVVYSMACLTAGFDHTSLDCIGEAFTENAGRGAIAYLGSSRIAVGTAGWSYAYEPSATGLEEDFVRALEDADSNDPSQLRVGRVHQNALEHFAVSFASEMASTSMMEFAQRSWLLMTLLGDPDSPVWTETPRNFNITNSTEGLPNGDVELTIKVTDTIDTVTGIENALVAISSGTSVYDFNYTDASGNAVFVISDATTEELEVTITKPNFIPFEGGVTIDDTFPPVTNLEITPAIPDGFYGWYCTTPKINLTTEPLAITYYRWGTGNELIYTDPLNVPDGNHTLYYYSVDLNDNTEVEAYYYMKVDTIAPTTAFNVTPELPDGDNDWYVSFPTIELTSEVNLTSESDITIFYHWDLDLDNIYSTAFQASEGNHTLYFHTVDKAGNIEPDQFMEFQIDTITPRTNISIVPTAPDGNESWYKTPVTINLSLNRSGGVEELQTTFYYRWDNASHSEYTANLTLPEGVHTLYYYAVDQAGNQESGNLETYKLDTAVSETNISISPAAPDGENGWYRTGPNITISTLEPLIGFENCSGEKIYYHWDSEPSKLYETNETLNLSEGKHTLYYNSLDVAGNIEHEHTMFFKLDSIAPITTIEIDPEWPDTLTDWYLSVPQIEFYPEDNVTTYYHWDNVTNQTYQPGNLTPPEEGIHTLYYFSVDEAGNIELESSREFKVDLAPPVAVLNVNLMEVYPQEEIIFYGDNSSDFNGITEYYFDFGDGNVTGWTNQSIINHNYTSSGIYDVVLKVRDSSGAINAKKANVTITINKKPKASQDDEWNILPEDPTAFSIMFWLIVLVIIVLLIIAAGYLSRKRRRYPLPRDSAAAHAAERKAASRRRPGYYDDYDYEEAPPVAPEIVWDEEEYEYEEVEPYYEEDYYDDYEEEYYDEQYPYDEEIPDEDEGIDWEEDEQEDDVDWASEDEDDEVVDEEADWDEDDEDEEEWAEEQPERYEDEYERDQEPEWDDDEEYDDEYEEEYEDYDGYDNHDYRSNDEYNRDSGNYDNYGVGRYYSGSGQSPQGTPPPPPPTTRIRKRRLIPTWRNQEVKRKHPGLLDLDDINVGSEDEWEDEF